MEFPALVVKISDVLSHRKFVRRTPIVQYNRAVATNNVITHLFGTTLPKGQRDDVLSSAIPNVVFTLDLPPGNGAERIWSHLDDAGAGNDTRNLFLGYPNLRRCMDELLKLVSADWPSREYPRQSALALAIERGVQEVKTGLQRDRMDKRQVIANFHVGLATIAQDLMAYNAIGCFGTKAHYRWDHLRQPFVDWYTEYEYDCVAFSRRSEVSQDDVNGAVWKMRSMIASIADLGIIKRFAYER